MKKFNAETETLLKLVLDVELFRNVSTKIVHYIATLANVETFTVDELWRKGELIAAANELLYLANNWNGPQWLDIDPADYPQGVSDKAFERAVCDRFETGIKAVRKLCLQIND